MAQLQIPLDAKRFATGLTWKDYMAQMGDTRARTEENYAKSELTDDERKFFSGVTGVKYAMMLAENWCGDVHRNSPLHRPHLRGDAGLRAAGVLPRPEPDLRDTFLNNGYQSIPVVVFFDKDWNEIGRWIERAHAATGKAALIRARTIDVAPKEAAGRGDERVPQAGQARYAGRVARSGAPPRNEVRLRPRAAARPRQEVAPPTGGVDFAACRGKRLSPAARRDCLSGHLRQRVGLVDQVHRAQTIVDADRRRLPSTPMVERIA